ncbi:hypothetical protein C8Q73DRAFT_714281 [Cubamyces lactineus]|nr:hypothetical protein C8Q73DRAFT_714281 [Cubamyces lactineus]
MAHHVLPSANITSDKLRLRITNRDQQLTACQDARAPGVDREVYFIVGEASIASGSSYSGKFLPRPQTFIRGKMSVQWGDLTTADVITLYDSLWIPQNYYLCIASIALVVYDYILTLPDEYRVIWRRGRSVASALYIANRYGLIVTAAVSCSVLEKLFKIEAVLLYVTFAAFSALRVHAINDRRWIWTVLVFLLGITPVPGNLSTFQSQAVSGYPVFKGCFQVIAVGSSASSQIIWNRYAIASRACLIAMDAIVLAITWYRTAEVITAARRAKMKGSLVSVMLRDGGLALVLNVADIVTIIMVLYGVPTHSLDGPSINSVTMTRFMLNLRVADALSCGDDVSTLWAQQLQLHSSNAVDVLGATIEFTDPASRNGDPDLYDISLTSISGSTNELEVTRGV